MKKLILKILGMNICGLCGGLFKPPPEWAIGKDAFYLGSGKYCIKCADEAIKYEDQLRQREHDLRWAKRNPDKLRAVVKEEEAKERAGAQMSQEQMQKVYGGLGGVVQGLGGLANSFNQINRP